MDIKKLAPWNWLKKETEETAANVPIQRKGNRPLYHDDSMVSPIVQFRREVDRVFENIFTGASPLTTAGLLKPQVDIGATDKEYAVTVEVPGVNEKDVRVEVSNNTMIIRGEKRQEVEEKEKDYYRVERTYGSFQRVLSLPEDSDQESIRATFDNGVLTIRIARKALPESNVRQIEIMEGS
jgi:HSP20 family protein